jgi:uncharacterized membrane protein
VPSLAVLTAALAVVAQRTFAASAGGGLPPYAHSCAHAAAVGAAVFGLYAASLLILQLFEWAPGAGVHASFERGHTAVSALWGVVGLVLVYAGLVRGWRTFRIAGLALFAVSLAKLFLYDLANLSSVTRALSFLAVGAIFLVAGFFYQRLSAADGTDGAEA